MKITKFDQTNLTAINTDLKEALAIIGDKYGIKFTRGTTNFSGESFTVKLSAAVNNVESGNAVVNVKWKMDFDRKAFFLEHAGLPKNSFGKEFMYNGVTCKLVGALPRKDYLIVQYGPDKFWSVPQKPVINAIADIYG